MTTTQRLGFDIVATDKTGAAFNSAKKLLDGVQGVQKAMNGFAAPMKQAERTAGAFGNRLQNVSFQVSDFAVQVSSGTDATRALAQQLPQLLGGLGIFGAAAGAAAAILLPLAQALGKTRDYAKELAEGLGKLDDAQKITKASIVDLTEEYGRYAGLIGDVAKLRESLAKAEIGKALSDEAKAIQDVNSGYIGTAGAIGEVINQWKNADFSRSVVAQMITPLDEATKSANNLKDKFGLTEKAARGAAEPLRVFMNGVANLNTDAAALGLAELNKWMAQNKEQAESLIPLYDALNTKLMAMLKLHPLSQDSMGMAFTPTTAANTYSNAAGDMKVAQQLAAIENQVAEKKRAVAEAARLAAEMQRKETSEFEQFVATVERGATPIQRISDTIRQAQENFARFGENLNPAQVAEYTAYIEDLNTKLDELTFKDKWDNMADGMQTVTDNMTPFKNMVQELGQDIENSFVNNLTTAFTSFIEGTQTAKQALASFAQSFLKEVTSMIIKALALYAVQKLIGLAQNSMAFGSLMQSHGGVYADGGVFTAGRPVHAFAGGGIVNSPTLFPMGGGGVGLMGEAGSEAIVPLSRRNGKLGVGASPVNVQINNYAGADVKTKHGDDGKLQIDIIKKVVAHDLARGGEISQGLERGYGVRRAGR